MCETGDLDFTLPMQIFRQSQFTHKSRQFSEEEHRMRSWISILVNILHGVELSENLPPRNVIPRQNVGRCCQKSLRRARQLFSNGKTGVAVKHVYESIQVFDRLRVSGRGAVRAEDDQGTPKQSHISPKSLVNEG